MRVLAGLLLALFSAVMSTMIVTNALPTIVADLDGSQTQYTWVVTASLLMMTVTTPVWGKLADQFSKKLLVQIAIVVFVLGSAGAGLSQSMVMLIVMRGIQGVAMGGLMANTQAIIGSIVPSRQRGKYAGYIGAVMAGATLCGPLVGGVIVDTSWLGWRWCFFVIVPFAIASLVVLQLSLHLPIQRRKVRVDYLGAVLVTITASLPLVWVAFAGDAFAWMSWQTAAFIGVTVVAGLLVAWVGSRHPEPIVPLSVLRDRTTALAIVGSIAVGVVMFSSMVFLGQYFQIARGYSPTEAGLLGIPMMIGSLVGTLGSGHLITRYGRLRIFLVVGSLILVIGLALLGVIDHATPEAYIVGSMVLVGLGMGTLLQNYVLAVQNTVSVSKVGTASASVAFFRSLGGAVGVSALGAMLAHLVAVSLPVASGGPESSLDLETLSPQTRELVRHAYGDATGQVFAVSACVAAASLVAALLIRERVLRTTMQTK